MHLTDSTAGIITVGDGRGFVIESARGRLVITAGRCLPSLPLCNGNTAERTYRALLGPLGGVPSVSAECLFVNPVADIAVLGPPDGQKLLDQADVYDELTRGVAALSIVDLWQTGPAWLLSLYQRWFGCLVKRDGGTVWIHDPVEEIVGGLAGRAIVTGSGLAIGVVCNTTHDRRPSGPHPTLTDQLPGWVLREIDRGRHKSAVMSGPLITDDSPESGIADLKRQLALEQELRPGARSTRRGI
jgi:hypothetical protein